MATTEIAKVVELALNVFKKHDWYYMMADGPSSYDIERAARASSHEFSMLTATLPASELEMMRNLWDAKEAYTKCEITGAMFSENAKNLKATMDDTMAKIETLLSESDNA